MCAAEYEYVVVGSGAGGGTVAARLAEAGRKVLLLEAGGDPMKLQGDDPVGKDRLPDDYLVPGWQLMAAENDAMKWDFYVRHYASDELQKRDPKFVPEKNGILYPRAGTLGGCTAHNAMIMCYPHNDDWDYVAQLTGDSSWESGKMRRYFELLEDCHHRGFLYRLLGKLGINPTRHGWGGWLRTEKAIPWQQVIKDERLVKSLTKIVVEAVEELPQDVDRFKWAIEAQGDPNDWRLVKKNAVGVRYAPLHTSNHARIGTRERVLDVARKYPANLTIELDALVTRVLFDGNRAVGVEYLKGSRLYRASAEPHGEPAETKQVEVSGEVILSGGAYNTPQLLMLSGVGPAAELERHGIDVKVPLDGVGLNLQDRYEVGLVSRMKEDWEVLKGATFTPSDPQYKLWSTKREGPWTTNGAVLALIQRSMPERILPDLFTFLAVNKFAGYRPGFSRDVLGLNYMTWVILKAHTNNTAGKVTLRSADPRDTPNIDFHYFTEGNDERGEDLESVVAAIKFMRTLNEKISKYIEVEELPGPEIQTDEEIGQWVKDVAWGHHASCTCKIGPKENNGVLDSGFRVHDTKSLRVVDASVFPKIPGFFIVTSCYMVGEKAADVILKGD